LTLSVKDPTGAKCPAVAKTYQIGNPDAPCINCTPNDAGDRLIDGNNNATIKCAVNGNGPFTFSGTIQGLSKQSDKVTLTITNGTISADKVTGTATVAVNTPQLAGTYVSAAGACTVAVVSNNVKPGSMWASITCPIITLSSTGQTCAVGETTNFVLENCEGT